MTMMSNNNRILTEDRLEYLNGVLVSSTRPTDKSRLLVSVDTHLGNHKNPNPFSFKIERVDRPKGWLRFSSAYGTHIVDIKGALGPDLGFFNPVSGEFPDSVRVYNKALKKLYEQLRESDVNLSIDAAERHQTQRMLRKAGKSLPGLFDFARRAKSKQRRGMTVEEAKNAIGNAWLSYTYGWRPLLSTIYGLATFERSILSRRKIKARSSSRNTLTTKVSGSTFKPPAVLRKTYSTRVEIGMIYHVVQPDLFDLTRLVSLNPLAIAWELVPYSFVVDWLLDVGGYMQAWEASWFLGLTFKSGYVTTSRKGVVNGIFEGTWYPDPASVFSGYGPFKSVLVENSRVTLSSPPTPRLPRFDFRMGWQRYTSAAALLNQILSPDPRLYRG